jgi:hypothetical protein
MNGIQSSPWPMHVSINIGIHEKKQKLNEESVIILYSKAVDVSSNW